MIILILLYKNKELTNDCQLLSDESINLWIEWIKNMLDYYLSIMQNFAVFKIIFKQKQELKKLLLFLFSKY
jgi:hypothetical protein